MKRIMFTDLYAFTMAAAYIQEGQSERRVTCELFCRRLPRNRRYMVAAGLKDMVDGLLGWQLADEDLRFLQSVPALQAAMTPAVVERFRKLRFTGDLWAMPEGTVFFPDEPVLRIEAPVMEAQLVETFLLSVFNHAASVASKAARVMTAAAGKPVVEFGMRRVHPDASVSATRTAYLMGLTASSNVMAGQSLGVPLTGTMAHAFVMVHDTEDAAFRQFLKTFPSKPTFLVDTYNTLGGIKRAIEVAGPALGGIRLDSGDLLELSRAARGMLDGAGLKEAKIIVSGDLDEHKVSALVRAGAPVDVYAVGTELAASADAPTLGAVYKVVHDHVGNRAVAKFSKDKATHAGVHQVFRHMEGGLFHHDVLGLQSDEPAGGEPLLRPVMKAGALLSPLPSLEESRAHAARQLSQLPSALKEVALMAFEPYPVAASQTAQALTETARRNFAAA